MNKEPKRPAKYEIGQYFLNNEKKQLFRIIDRSWIEWINRGTQSKVKDGEQKVRDWLYNIEYPQAEENKKYSRYYEERLTEECTLIDDQKLPKAIYE